MNLGEYRASKREQARTQDLLRLLPRRRRSVLDIGARDGHFSRLLTEHFEQVTALDLARPSFEIPGVVTVAGDVTRLEFGDESFDCVFCAEVLEHVRDVESACREITRVAAHDVIVGVPFRQDLRYERTTCRACGRANPPYGHVHSFDEERLLGLFPGLQVRARSFVETTRKSTNRISTFLMDLAGNPRGTYHQDEPCIHCGSSLARPENIRLWQLGCLVPAVGLNLCQKLLTRPRPNWIHLALTKQPDT